MEVQEAAAVTSILTVKNLRNTVRVLRHSGSEQGGLVQGRLALVVHRSQVCLEYELLAKLSSSPIKTSTTLRKSSSSDAELEAKSIGRRLAAATLSRMASGIMCDLTKSRFRSRLGRVIRDVIQRGRHLLNGKGLWKRGARKSTNKFLSQEGFHTWIRALPSPYVIM